nr:AAA family ATPase [Planosporangium flavigriseum]
MTKISAHNFLSFDVLELDLGPGLTILTGPNGVGKTNVGRCLDVALAVMARYGGGPPTEAQALYESAGNRGASAYQVALGLTLDQPWERSLILSYIRTAYACCGLGDDAAKRRNAASLDVIGRARITEESLTPLWTGTLHIRYDAGLRSPWFAAWEFHHGDRTCHITLVGANSGQLRGGPAEALLPPVDTSINIAMALTSTIPGLNVDAPTDEHDTDDPRRLMDLANTLPGPGQAFSMHMNTQTDMSAPAALSLRELAARLQVSDYERYNFEFAHVLWEILRRQFVITDNRRVPFRRRFAHAAFDLPIDVRDGSNIPAELFRLRNGDVTAQRRYAAIEHTFRDLTGRRLGLRTRVEPTHISADGLIIEPTVITDDREYPIEFAGAGAQEALVLSFLLPGEPGRVIVLDEPAVNVEPTMQRRLIRTLRTTGQCVVITHSPDVVPVDQPGDLENIIRLAPTKAGPRPRRAGLIHRREWSRWLKLFEPTHVRALLFASKDILCEGATEVGALRQWWSDTALWQLPNPEAENMPIIDVGGDHGFGGYIEYLDAFGIPWAAIVDGPALRPNSTLAQQLHRLGHRPQQPPIEAVNFTAFRAYWAQAGVFTVADTFGDDGTKAGEFEAFLARIDPQLLDDVRTEIGTRSKPQIGALFAARHPAPPAAVASLYQTIMTHLGAGAASVSAPLTGSGGVNISHAADDVRPAPAAHHHA